MKLALKRRLIWGLGGLWAPAYCLLLTLAPRYVRGSWQGLLLTLSFPILLALPMFLIGLAYTSTFPGQRWAPRRWNDYSYRAGFVAVAVIVAWLMIAPPDLVSEFSPLPTPGPDTSTPPPPGPSLWQS